MRVGSGTKFSLEVSGQLCIFFLFVCLFFCPVPWPPGRNHVHSGMV